jgi:hypothetical protein
MITVVIYPLYVIKDMFKWPVGSLLISERAKRKHFTLSINKMGILIKLEKGAFVK